MSEFVMQHQANPGNFGANISAFYFNNLGVPSYVGNDNVPHELGGSVSNLTVSNSATFNGRIIAEFTDTATVGNVTINKPVGRVNVTANTTQVVVTNNVVTANSHVFCQAAANDATGRVTSVVRATGNFTIHCTAPTANMPVDFFVLSGG